MKIQKQMVAIIISFGCIFFASGLINDIKLFIGILLVVAAHSILATALALESENLF
jgi:hypothetical protein